MRTFIKRSESNRRQPINDVDYFARGGEERRSPGVERRDFDFRYEAPEQFRNPRSILNLFR